MVSGNDCEIFHRQNPQLEPRITVGIEKVAELWPKLNLTTGNILETISVHHALQGRYPDPQVVMERIDYRRYPTQIGSLRRFVAVVLRLLDGHLARLFLSS